MTTIFGATGPKQALLALSEHNLINFGSFPILFVPLLTMPVVTSKDKKPTCNEEKVKGIKVNFPITVYK